MCPVKLLLIQALRGGYLRDASSLGEALAIASRRVDRTIQWLHPKLPVIPAICRPNYAFLDCEKPASRMQLYDTTLQLGLVAGVMAKLRTHDWRRGSAKDLANLKDKISGVADHTVALAIGQSRKTLGRGITDDYVGDIEVDLFSARVASDFQHKHGPAIGAPFQKTKLELGEALKYCEDNNIEPTESGLQTARRHIYAAQLDAWMEKEKNRDESPPTTLPGNSQQQRRTRPLKQRTPSQLNSLPAPGQKLQTSGVDLLEESALGSSSFIGTVDQGLMGLIDPKVLFDSADQGMPLEEVGQCSASQSDVVQEAVQQITQVLDGTIAAGHPERDEDDEFMGLGIILANIQSAQESTPLLSLPGPEFVDALSKINVVHNTSLDTHLTTLDDVFPTKVPMGNSRDYPSLFQFCCSNGCGYKHPIKGRVSDHMLVCKPKAETAKPFFCDRLDDEGHQCPKAFATATGLKEHVADVHDWVPKKCNLPECPTPDTTFATRKLYANHITIHHKLIDPTLCTYPKCDSKTIFNTRWLYSAHLRTVHKLMSAQEKREYLPDQPKKTSFFPQCVCPLGGSKTCETTFKTARGLQGHLTSKAHDLSAVDAKKITDDIAGGS